MANPAPNFVPRKKKQHRTQDDSARPNAHARGYCSKHWKALRALALVRDMWQCQVCSSVIATPRHAHVDHIVPKSRGGSDSLENLQTLCASCHAKKGLSDGSRRTSSAKAKHGKAESNWCETMSESAPSWSIPPRFRSLGGSGG